MKPTWGLVSMEGIKPFAPSLDTIGWFARSVGDLRLLYDVFDPESEPMGTIERHQLRIATCRTPMWDRAEPATRAVFAHALEMLTGAGIAVEEVEFPVPLFDRLTEHQLVIMRLEARVALLAEARRTSERLDPELQRFVDNHWGYTRADLRKAYDQAARCREVFDGLSAPFDAVLVPSTLGEPPRGLSETGSFVFNGIWTLLHTPCINVPGPPSAAGMPMGLTLTGPRFSDRRILAAAEAFQLLLRETGIG